MKEIPNFNIELAQATDYILGSPLAKKAFICPPFQNFINMITDIISWIDRLADNCHMPELTNHALPHICSIVKRASEWGESDGWLEKSTSQEAGYLLMALLIHDIGMLSQDMEDIPEDEKLQNMKGLSNVGGWVRRTHVIRIENLVKNLLKTYIDKDKEGTLSPHLDVIIGMAKSHAKWPWEPDFVTQRGQIAAVGLKEERIGAFNAVIAVCDLLDEDSERCDTLTLIKHHYGTTENKAHWIRHALTKHVEGVKNHRVAVQFRKLPSKEPYLDILYRTLRNHYRLIKLYQENLAVIEADILHLDFEPGDGIPEEEDEISGELVYYQQIPELQYDIVPHIMVTFMKEARNQDGGNPELRKRLDRIGLETIDMSELDDFFYPGALLYPEERVLFGRGTVSEILRYAYDLAEKAYVNGEIEKLRHICGAVIERLKPHDVTLKQIYWAITYLLIYEKQGMDFEAAEQMHQNYLHSKLPSDFYDVETISEDIFKGIPTDDPYQGLLDVLIYFLKPPVLSKTIKLCQEYLMKYHYANLQDDFATIQLIRTVVGMFWFWDGKSNVWYEISEHIQQETKSDRIDAALNMQQKCLKLQYKMLYGGGEITETELMAVDYPVLARAWKHFFEEDWKRAVEDIPRMIACAERNPDLFGSVQGFQNMTYIRIKWSKPDQNFKAAKYRETGIRRYERNAGEQERSEFWQSRESAIETLLARNLKEAMSGTDALARQRVIRLIILRKLEALQYWNIGEYLEAVRNEAGWFYDLAVYEDEYGEYQGIDSYLPEAIMMLIQSMDSNKITKEEMQRLIAKMYYHFPAGYEDVVHFLISTPQKCTWRYGISWLEYFITDLDSKQLSQILKWIVEQYDPFIRTQTYHWNLGEYECLWQAASRFSEDDWNILFPILKRIYQNYPMYNANKKFVRNSLQYMPFSFCEEILDMVETWSSEPVKRKVVYEICISLSQRWKDKITDRLHQFIQNCQTVDSSRTQIYQDLEQLIDINNLLERTDIDIEGIGQSVESVMKQLQTIDLSGYNSEVFQNLKEKFVNQNWSLVSKEKVLVIIQNFFSVLKNRKEMSKDYFFDICELFHQMSRMAEKDVKKEIAAFFIKEYILQDSEETGITEQWNNANGPLDNVRFGLFDYRKWEQGVVSVLLDCMTEIPEEYSETYIWWICRCLEEDTGVWYYYAVSILSYYYFTNTGEMQKTALCGLLYIRGRIEAKGKYFESQLRHVLVAWRNLKLTNQWFGEKTFQQLADQDQNYKEQFQKPIQNLMKKSGSSEIRHWDEKQDQIVKKS